jgi:hypothetical protein
MYILAAMAYEYADEESLRLQHLVFLCTDIEWLYVCAMCVTLRNGSSDISRSIFW